MEQAHVSITGGMGEGVDHRAYPLHQSSTWWCRGGGGMAKNNLKISQMKKDVYCVEI